jgi:hypothetical protein
VLTLCVVALLGYSPATLFIRARNRTGRSCSAKRAPLAQSLLIRHSQTRTFFCNQRSELGNDNRTRVMLFAVGDSGERHSSDLTASAEDGAHNLYRFAGRIRWARALINHG